MAFMNSMEDREEIQGLDPGLGKIQGQDHGLLMTMITNSGWFSSQHSPKILFFWEGGFNEPAGI
jgi:hypothetical protein